METDWQLLPTSIICPVCKAQAGSSCIRANQPNETTEFLGRTHAGRKALARETALSYSGSSVS